MLLRLVVLTALLVPAGASLATARPAARLTLDQRVEALRAIERVHYQHMAGAAEPFDTVYPHRLLESQARRSLRLSVALETFWGVRVTAGMLHEEAARMARDSRMPERLLELHRALDDDPLLILECLVRPALVERMARGLFASSPPAGAEGRSWDDWWSSVEESLDLTRVVPLDPSEPIPRPDRQERALTQEAPTALVGEGCVPNDVWSGSSLGGAPIGGARQGHTAVWSSGRMYVWGGLALGKPVNTGYRYDAATDVATPLSGTNAPTARSGHTAVWAGGRMVVWGGRGANGAFLADGKLFNPTTNSWATLNATNAPVARAGHSAIWTGSLIVVWGGEGTQGLLASGGMYELSTDTWTAISSLGAPSARKGHTAIWTGAEMIVWGGEGPGYLDTGARYIPFNSGWTSLPAENAPTARTLHTAVWAGEDMIVWGGAGAGGDVNTGARFSTTTGSWSPLSTAGAPSPRRGHTAVWGPGTMIVWGGGPSGQVLDSGGMYDMESDSWVDTPLQGAPSPRKGHTAVWTGSRLIVWGGNDLITDLGSGARLNPAAGTWSGMTVPSRPLPRQWGSAIWTGNEMILWGGLIDGQGTATGGRYDPVLDLWRDISRAGAPSSGAKPVSVWTGSRMVHWSGGGGGRYDPITDTWEPMSLVHAPAAGGYPVGVWTGTELLVWNGQRGGRYNPTTNVWRPVSTVGAPFSGWPTAAVWTGDRMVIWGTGGSIGTFVSVGGRYDPITNTWLPISSNGAPQPRFSHVMVWTGQDVLVWGGGYRTSDTYVSLGDGGRYDPVNDTWQPLASRGSIQVGHFDSVGVWTGSRLLVQGGREYWGGFNCCYDYEWVYLGGGGLYDPATNTWSPISTAGAPSPRATHAGVWAGDRLIVFGGLSCQGLECGLLDSGGIYGSGLLPDADGDGVGAACDCDDAAAAVRPGGPQICGDNLNNDCLDPAWPALTGTNESDADADGVSACAGDCNDAIASVAPGAPEVCDGLSNDCLDAAWPVPPDMDLDGDGHAVCASGPTDCDDENSAVWSAPSSATMFFADPSPAVPVLQWEPGDDPGADVVFYDVLRSPSATNFQDDTICLASDMTWTATSVGGDPGPGQAYYILIRSRTECPPPNETLGAGSNGVPRVGRACP